MFAGRIREQENIDGVILGGTELTELVASVSELEQDRIGMKRATASGRIWINLAVQLQ